MAPEAVGFGYQDDFISPAAIAVLSRHGAWRDSILVVAIQKKNHAYEFILVFPRKITELDSNNSSPAFSSYGDQYIDFRSCLVGQWFAFSPINSFHKQTLFRECHKKQTKRHSARPAFHHTGISGMLVI